MINIKIRFPVSKIEFRELASWLTAGLAAGSIPALILQFPIGFWILVGVWLLAITVGSLLWYHDRRKVGVGVFVHLPSPSELDQDSAQRVLPEIHRLMKSRHHGWFRSGPENSDTFYDTSRRADWIIRSIQYRFDETRLTSGNNTPLFLYLFCRNPESYSLGSRARQVWRQQDNQLPASANEGAPAQIPLDFRVRQFDTYTGKTDELFELDLSKVTLPPTDKLGGAISSDVVNLSNVSSSTQPSSTPRLAIIIHAGEQKGLEPFKRFALDAAKGGSCHGYLTTESDVCDNAIIFPIDQNSLVSALREARAEPFVQRIYEDWRDQSILLYGRDDVPVRVFMTAPSLLAFALGSIFPNDSRIIPYDRELEVASTAAPKNGGDYIIAIVDGDDVGSVIEQYMLKDDLDEVIAFSSSVDDAMGNLTTTLSSIVGVTHLSTGGDSALFRIAGTSWQVSDRTIEILRSKLSFKFSCGYGSTVRDAFLALRIAKTSGKNSTKKLASNLRQRKEP